MLLTPPFKEYQVFPIKSCVFSGYQIGLVAQKLSTSGSAIVALVVLLPSPCSSGVVRNAVRQAQPSGGDDPSSAFCKAFTALVPEMGCKGWMPSLKQSHLEYKCLCLGRFLLIVIIKNKKALAGLNFIRVSPLWGTEFIVLYSGNFCIAVLFAVELAAILQVLVICA